MTNYLQPNPYIPLTINESGIPNDIVGINGDIYNDTTNSTSYIKINEKWLLIDFPNTITIKTSVFSNPMIYNNGTNNIEIPSGVTKVQITLKGGDGGPGKNTDNATGGQGGTGYNYTFEIIIPNAVSYKLYGVVGSAGGEGESGQATSIYYNKSNTLIPIVSVSGGYAGGDATGDTGGNGGNGMAGGLGGEPNGVVGESAEIAGYGDNVKFTEITNQQKDGYIIINYFN